MTRDEILEGLRAGRTLVVDRRDAPALPIALGLVEEGLAVSEFVQYDEQSSALKFRLAQERSSDA
jgi:hypothetical protein